MDVVAKGDCSQGPRRCSLADWGGAVVKHAALVKKKGAGAEFAQANAGPAAGRCRIFIVEPVKLQRDGEKT